MTSWFHVICMDKKIDSIHSGSKPVSAGVLPECKYKLREPEVFYRGAIFVKISSIDQAGI